MGSINANMGVPRTGLLVACLESSGRLQIFKTRYSDLTDCSQCTVYMHELDPRGQIIVRACQLSPLHMEAAFTRSEVIGVGC
jgi:hypothetical protein